MNVLVYVQPKGEKAFAYEVTDVESVGAALTFAETHTFKKCDRILALVPPVTYVPAPMAVAA